jgi:UDP:flavonoid glycosyltransferase YjiC (YdhE family)
VRVLFTSLAARPHVLALVPLAWAFRAAGHDVRVAAQPSVSDMISRCGLPAVAVGGDHDLVADIMDFLRRHPTLMRPDGQLAVMDGGPQGEFGLPWIRSAEAIAPDLIAFGERWRPQLVVTDPMFYAGPVLAEVLGVPLVRHLWGPDWRKSGYGLGGFAEGQTTVDWPPELVRLFESYGVRSAVDFAAGTVDPFPPSLQVPGLANRVTMRQVPYNGSEVLPGWLAEPPALPRVCVTCSTSNMPILGEEGFYVPKVLAGLAGLEVEIVVAIGRLDRERLGEPPPRTRLVENLPFDLLLPSCAALVSHGGGGAMVTAAVHGVPQVTIPMLADQPTNARLLAATGAGITLDATALDEGTVASAVETVLAGDGPRAAARRLQAEIRGLPPPAEIVERLEKLVE